jgi:DNA mismatch repair protein MutH
VSYGPHYSSFPARKWTSATPAANRFPNYPNELLDYNGPLAFGKYLTMVDVTLNNYNPCVTASIATGAAKVTHSGVVQAASGTSVVTIPQNPLFDFSKTYAICYAETNTGAADSTWRDSYIRAKLTKLGAVIAHGVTHRTDGSIAKVAGIEMTYQGSVENAKWIALLDQTLNGGYPCDSGATAAGAASTRQSGPLRAANHTKMVTFSSMDLDTSKTYSVCYAEVTGDAADTWSDSGIRLLVSKITSVAYGTESTSFPSRQMTAQYVYPATNRLPQGLAGVTKSITVKYVGSLANRKFLSFVDVSLNSNNPCVQGAIAAGDNTDNQHSGSSQAGVSDKKVTFELNGGYVFDVTKTYTFCYAESTGLTDDATWRDSYVRLTISKLESVASHAVTHVTDGSIPRVAGLQMVYDGSLPAAMYISLIAQTLNNNFPCASGAAAAAATDSSHSGVKQATGAKLFTLDTTGMSTSNTYAVCYAQVSGASTDSWTDSGIRLGLSKVTLFSYGTVSTSFPVRTWDSRNAPLATNRWPQAANAIVTYIGDLDNYKWLSFVDAALNSNNPCVDAPTTAHVADTVHSGSQRAASGTKAVTIPQAAGKLLDVSKSFALCYAETDGGTSDSTWRDSYVRVKTSKIETLSAHLVTHVTDGSIATVTTLQLTYGGSLANNKWVSLVDKTLNSNFPCGLGSVAAGAVAASNSAYSGVIRAGAANKVLVVDTTKMSTSLTFAVCYAETSGEAGDTWTDTGLRIQVAKIKELHYGLIPAVSPIRIMTSTNLAAATNRLPQVANTVVTYSGTLDNYKWLSIVDKTLNGNNPCVSGAVAAATADSTHSGAQRAASGT